MFIAGGRRRKKTSTSQQSPLKSLPVVGDGLDLRRLGSPYGGWVVSHRPSLTGGVFLSAGAGEDISFDVELADLYSMHGLIIDPTPRAITHVEAVLAANSSRRLEPYTLDGSQPISSYDLSHLKADALTLIPKALWVDDDGIEMIPPLNPSNVSHSIHPKHDIGGGDSLHVDTVSPESLAREYGDDVVLMKLDIEGAEVDVIAPLLHSFPRVEQFLIEFDVEKVIRDEKESLTAQSLDTLERHGFMLAHRSGRNFLFVREIPGE